MGEVVAAMAAASDPIVAISRPACERPLWAIPDVPTNLLGLNSGTDAACKPGAAHFALAPKPVPLRTIMSLRNLTCIIE
jgi:hypothetical protein